MNDDVRLHGKLHGESGPPVLLLPGGAADCEGFFPGMVEGLIEAPGCRVIVHDRPGTGTSTVDGTLTEATTHLHRLIGSLGTGPVVVVGQSLGGAVAALLARDYPGDVAGVVLLDPTPFNDERLIGRVEHAYRVVASAARVPMVRRLLARWTDSIVEKEIRRLRIRRDCTEAYRRMAQFDFGKLESALTGLTELSAAFRESDLPEVPAAVISADRKPGSRVTAAHQRLADGFGCPLTVWPGATHGVHLDHPDEVLSVVRDVVNQADARV